MTSFIAGQHHVEVLVLRLKLVPLLALASLGLACLEPNPNADAGSDSVGTDSVGTTADTTTTDTTTETTGPSCEACDFAFEAIDFETKAGSFVDTIPKPDQPFTVPIAVIRLYDPGNGDDLGYEVSWSDQGAAWQLSVQLIGGGGNAKVGGVAAVFGVAEEPEVQEIDLSVADMCASINVADLGGRWLVDAVERYDPGGAVLSYARTQTVVGPGADIEYCLAGPNADATLHARVVALPTSIDATIVELAGIELDGSSAGADFPEIAAGAAVVHLVAAQAYDDEQAPDLAYDFSCNGAAPFACNFSLQNFSAGASAVAGGVVVAVP